MGIIFLNIWNYAYEEFQCSFYLLVGGRYFFFQVQNTGHVLKIVGFLMGFGFALLRVCRLVFNCMVVMYDMISFDSVYISDKYP